MSLVRTALRLGVVNALRAHPVIASMLGPRLYDSRIGNFDKEEIVPVIVVTTEEHRGHALSDNNGGPPFRDECDLVIEIGMRATEQTDGGVALVTAFSDFELEATLDLLESCVLDALASADTDARRLLGSAVLRRLLEHKSSRFATDETGERFAVRLVTLRAEMKNNARRNALTPVAGPYGGLPEPLRLVCEAAPDGTADKQICDFMAARLPPIAPRDSWQTTVATSSDASA